MKFLVNTFLVLLAIAFSGAIAIYILLLNLVANTKLSYLIEPGGYESRVALLLKVISVGIWLTFLWWVLK